jgi:dienelactone hydrolase
MNEQPPSVQNAPLKKSLGRRVLRGFLVLAGIAVVASILASAGGWMALQVSNSKYFEGYDHQLAGRGEVVEREPMEGSVREKIWFEGIKGEKIPALFHLPSAKGERFPCVVLLYGIGQKMSFLDDIAESFTRAGYAIICPEQLGQGERRPEDRGGALAGVLRLRKRGSQTVLEARRMLDYLDTRSDIDPERRYLFGVSLGAILGTSALALEPRYQAGILMWGGGDFKRLFTSRPGNEDPNAVMRLLGRIGNLMMDPADPIYRIDQVSPRPLLFQNALHDEIVPKVCTEAYYAKAGDPKEILWYDCGHENGLTEELILKIMDDQVQWLNRLQEPAVAKGK